MSGWVAFHMGPRLGTDPGSRWDVTGRWVGSACDQRLNPSRRAVDCEWAEVVKR